MKKGLFTQLFEAVAAGAIYLLVWDVLVLVLRAIGALDTPPALADTNSVRMIVVGGVGLVDWSLYLLWRSIPLALALFLLFESDEIEISSAPIRAAALVAIAVVAAGAWAVLAPQEAVQSAKDNGPDVIREYFYPESDSPRGALESFLRMGQAGLPDEALEYLDKSSDMCKADLALLSAALVKEEDWEITDPLWCKWGRRVCVVELNGGAVAFELVRRSRSWFIHEWFDAG